MEIRIKINLKCRRWLREIIKRETAYDSPKSLVVFYNGDWEVRPYPNYYYRTLDYSKEYNFSDIRQNFEYQTESTQIKIDQFISNFFKSLKGE